MRDAGARRAKASESPARGSGSAREWGPQHQRKCWPLCAALDWGPSLRVKRVFVLNETASFVRLFVRAAMPHNSSSPRREFGCPRPGTRPPAQRGFMRPARCGLPLPTGVVRVELVFPPLKTPICLSQSLIKTFPRLLLGLLVDLSYPPPPYTAAPLQTGVSETPEQFRGGHPGPWSWWRGRGGWKVWQMETLSLKIPEAILRALKASRARGSE